jgi:hypothetical protein
MGSLGGIAFLRHLDRYPKLSILVPGVNGFGFEGNRLERADFRPSILPEGDFIRMFCSSSATVGF